MVEITMSFPLETREYKIPIDVARQSMVKFGNMPIVYHEIIDGIVRDRVVGVVDTSKLDGDKIVVGGYLFKDAAIEFSEFDDKWSMVSIDMYDSRRGKK